MCREKKEEEAKPKVIQLVDGRRAQSVEIGLSRFGMSVDNIRAAVLLMDPQAFGGADKLKVCSYLEFLRPFTLVTFVTRPFSPFQDQCLFCIAYHGRNVHVSCVQRLQTLVPNDKELRDVQVMFTTHLESVFVTFYVFYT